MTKKRFYVTKNWHDYPEGGSYGTVVEAETSEEANLLCSVEMAESYANSQGDDSFTAATALADYKDDWITVDCFDLDEFITRHARKGSTEAVRESARVILNVIEEMREAPSEAAADLTDLMDDVEENGWFGGFEMGLEDVTGGYPETTYINWPNLAICADELESALEQEAKAILPDGNVSDWDERLRTVGAHKID